jgi:plastocyanin
MTKWLALLCACLALVLVGCGDDDEDDGGGDGGGGGAAQTQTQEETETSEGGGRRVQVSMEDIQFKPAKVTVPRGGIVEWTNNESVGHDVTKESGPGPDFKSGDPGAMGQGDSYFRDFDSPGTIEYVCTVHAPGMKGTITVR